MDLTFPILCSIALYSIGPCFYHSNPSLCPTSNAEEAEVERFYEDLQDLLELTPEKDVQTGLLEKTNLTI